MKQSEELFHENFAWKINLIYSNFKDIVIFILKIR